MANDAAKIWAEIAAHNAALAAQMPDTATALRTMLNSRERLRQLGWSDGTYCPKDGSTFAIIQHGSSGIFSAFYIGDRPGGYVMCGDYLYRPEGIMWKAIDKLTTDEAAHLNACDANEFAAHERMVKNLAAMEQTDAE